MTNENKTPVEVDEFDFPSYDDKPSNRGGSFAQLKPKMNFLAEIIAQEAKRGDKVGTPYDGQYQTSLTVRPVGLDGKVTGPRGFINLNLPLERKFKDESGKVVTEPATKEIWDKFKFSLRDISNGEVPSLNPAKRDDGLYQDKNVAGEFVGPTYTKDQVYGKDASTVDAQRTLMLKQIAQKLAINAPVVNKATGEVVEPLNLVGKRVVCSTSEVKANGKVYVNITGAASNPQNLLLEFENFEAKGEVDSDIAF